MKNRAIRRHHAQRLKNKLKKYHGGWSGESPKNLGLTLKTRHSCSDYCCGNPRKHFKELTKQEKIKTLEFELKAAA